MEIRLKEILAEKGMTSVFLANSLGVSKQTISNLINGRTMPSIETLQKAAEVLGVPLWQFFENPKKIAEITPSKVKWTENKPVEIEFICPECGEHIALNLECLGTLDVKK